MSTPVDEQGVHAQRAAVLAEQTANALAAARSRLGLAADAAEDLDGLLRRGENDIDELAGQANRVRTADEPEPFLRNARALAEDVDRRLRNGRRGLGEVRDHLDESTRAIAAGRQFLDELEQLPGQRSEGTGQLRYRLETLDRAARGAVEGVDRTDARLTAAGRNLQPLLDVPGRIEDRARTAALIDEVGADVQSDVADARGAIRDLREDFEHTSPQAWRAAQESSDLAIALRAGMNPTPRSAQHAPAASSDQDLRLRPDGPARDLKLDL